MDYAFRDSIAGHRCNCRGSPVEGAIVTRCNTSNTITRRIPHTLRSTIGEHMFSDESGASVRDLPPRARAAEPACGMGCRSPT